MIGKRDVSVGFVDKSVFESFEQLRNGSSDEKQLYEFLMRAIDDLKSNPYAGIKIQRNLWPKEYVQKYGINNLWKYNLPNAWRLIYFIRGNQIEVISVILEWMDHKNYEKRFGY